ncbi:TrmH family RNA methyltransferase [Tengunoibacter tsumagoiensis]|uniref:Uncharacterized protein n=1 Tax=Tengunoibacter tsumagoiensis TaxID=2014871 RepID=A0A402A6N5_9CHLR|nr:TrmH family RNA methyltransferase [Tengunoibacter tsumagoiensis]GCE14800.1 hypothetical protein KTT_46590 [Tengunoibacter tsumagoiensis]
MIYFEDITTIKDPRIVEARTLTSAVGRARLKKCLIEGIENIERALAADMHLEHIFYHLAARDDRFLTQLMRQGIACYGLSDGILKKVTHTNYLVPYVGVAALPEEIGTTMDSTVMVIDNTQNHATLGKLIREARISGLRDLISTDHEIDLFFRNIVTSSAGAVFGSRLKRCYSAREALDLLQRQGYQLMTTHPLTRDFAGLAVFQTETKGVGSQKSPFI